MKLRFKRISTSQLPEWFDVTVLQSRGMIEENVGYQLYLNDKPTGTFIVKTGFEDRDSRWGLVNYIDTEKGKEYWMAFFSTLKEAKDWVISELRKRFKGERMTKSDVVKAVAEKAGIKKNVAESAINAFLEVVIEALKNGDKVEIRGFGTFLMKERAARVARNPKTGKKVKVPAKLVPAFKPGKELKEATEKAI
jgi:DNA-binding protein HU-beta